jgi:hypothetical protein
VKFAGDLDTGSKFPIELLLRKSKVVPPSVLKKVTDFWHMQPNEEIKLFEDLSASEKFILHAK